MKTCCSPTLIRAVSLTWIIGLAWKSRNLILHKTPYGFNEGNLPTQRVDQLCEWDLIYDITRILHVVHYKGIECGYSNHFNSFFKIKIVQTQTACIK